MMSDPKSEEFVAGEECETVETASDLIEETVGARLRAAREERDLALKDVAKLTRQSQETLSALETMETKHISASILRLQARDYARFLGLPEQDIIAGYADAPGEINPEAMPGEASKGQVSPKMMIFAGGALAATALVVAGIMLLVRPGPAEVDDPLAISARLAPSFVEDGAFTGLSAVSQDEFSIRATKRAWIEVRGSDGTVFRNRQMNAGEIYYPRMEAGWTITVRDAGAFEWRLGEQSLDVVGGDQQALYSVSIDSAYDSLMQAQRAALAEASGSAPPR
ncbi:MAG: RodZ domain-containing protein [Pseudomonadota bacterium]